MDKFPAGFMIKFLLAIMYYLGSVQAFIFQTPLLIHVLLSSGTAFFLNVTLSQNSQKNFMKH